MSIVILMDHLQSFFIHKKAFINIIFQKCYKDHNKYNKKKAKICLQLIILMENIKNILNNLMYILAEFKLLIKITKDIIIVQINKQNQF